MKGSIQPRGPGRWQLTIDRGKKLDGRRRRVFVTVHGTKTDARRKLVSYLHAIQSGTFADASRRTLRDFLAHWLDDAKARVSAHTHARYKEIVDKNIVPWLGDRPLSKLGPMDLSALYAELLERGRADGKGGLSTRTVHHVHVVLRSALRQAVKWQLLTHNPSDAATPPRPQRMEMRALDELEVARLIAAAKGTRLYLPILLAWTTGMRLGEIFGLRWQDVDTNRGRLTVNQTLETIGRQINFKSPKTARSRRTIALPAALVEGLAAHRAVQEAEREVAGRSYREHDLVLADGLGRPWKPFSMQTLFQRIVKDAKVGNLRFHDLRHSHATQLLRMGVNPKIVSERLGHSTVGITLDTYSHVMPGMQEDVARKVDASLRASIELVSAGVSDVSKLSVSDANVGGMSAEAVGQATFSDATK